MENTQTDPVERRRRRSTDTMTALHYQLAFARHEGEFDALVLADATGCVVAGAGAWPTCEMLAAYAPLLAHRDGDQWLAAELDALAPEVEVQTMSIEGSEVLICGRGGGALRTTTLARAASGCRRILGVAA